MDEADAAHRLIGFAAPIARAILGLGVGDTATLRTGRGEELLAITSALVIVPATTP